MAPCPVKPDYLNDYVELSASSGLKTGAILADGRFWLFMLTQVIVLARSFVGDKVYWLYFLVDYRVPYR